MDTGLIAAIGAAVFITVALVYYYRYERPRAEIKRRLELMHFDVYKFIEDNKPFTFDFYNKKLQNLLFMWLIPTTLSVIIPRLLLPFPMSAFVTTVATIFLGMAVYIASIQLNERERESAMNKPFGPTVVYFPELGDRDLLFRRMEFVNEIKIDEEQRETMAEKIVRTIQDMPEYRIAQREKTRRGELSMNKLRSQILERLEKMHVNRYIVNDAYHILLITSAPVNEMVTSQTTPIIDRTIDVNVPLMPLWLVYGGTTERVFKSRDTNGKIIYTARKMGIFMDLYSLARREAELLGGGFVAPDKMTLLLGEFIHLWEQKAWSSTEMTKAQRAMEKAKLEADRDEFNVQAEANNLAFTGSKLLELLNKILAGGTRGVTDYGMWLIMFALGSLLMLLMVRAGIVPP